MLVLEEAVPSVFSCPANKDNNVCINCGDRLVCDDVYRVFLYLLIQARPNSISATTCLLCDDCAPPGLPDQTIRIDETDRLYLNRFVEMCAQVLKARLTPTQEGSWFSRNTCHALTDLYYKLLFTQHELIMAHMSTVYDACMQCEKRQAKMHCPRCFTSWYCSKGCAVAHFLKHQVDCHLFRNKKLWYTALVFG